MTRSAKATQTGSAKRKAPAAVRAVPEPASMKFLVVEENGGGYHWAIVAGGGEALGQSASFASYEEAKQAARVVHGGTSSASFEDDSGDALPAGDAVPVDLRARRAHVTAPDALDAERWLDEGGSFSSEAVTR